MGTSLCGHSPSYDVSAEQVTEFHRNGHILLRRIASSEEVAAYRSVIVAAREQFGAERTPLEERDTYGKAFLKGMNLWEKDEGVRRFVLARRFARIAADLLDVEGVRVYHDQALLKEPGGGITPWHQDQHYWPLDTDNTITMWMSLVDVFPTMAPCGLPRDLIWMVTSVTCPSATTQSRSSRSASKVAATKSPTELR